MSTSVTALRVSSMFTEPLNGWRYADAQEHRTREEWANKIKWLPGEQYPDAIKVVLVMNNLNTHATASLYQTFPPEEAFRLAIRLGIHYTPKHGSWLIIDCRNRAVCSGQAMHRHKSNTRS